MTNTPATDIRQREGLPEDACVLVPVDDADEVPMRTPEGASVMLVAAVGLHNGTTTLDGTIGSLGTTSTDRVVDVALFAGCWLPDWPPANQHEGDVVIRLTPPTWRDGDRVDVQMLQLYQHRWQIVGTWYDIGNDWPHIAAPTAHAVMGLHTDLCEATRPVARVELQTDRL